MNTTLDFSWHFLKNDQTFFKTDNDPIYYFVLLLYFYLALSICFDISETPSQNDPSRKKKDDTRKKYFSNRLEILWVFFANKIACFSYIFISEDLTSQKISNC